MSQESTTAADSTENLIRRLEDLKNEIDELKLNLKASQEIIKQIRQPGTSHQNSALYG